MEGASLIAEYVGVGVFALTGAIVAARKGMDPFGFALLATVTGVGGGSVRDMLLGVPVFWVHEPVDLAVCLGVGLLTYLAGSRIPGAMTGQRPRTALLWADALGLAIFSTTGALKALSNGAHPFAAVVLGTLTASFGGIIRDILAGDVPLVLHREIYVTAAVVGAAVFVLGLGAGLPPALAAGFSILAAFTLRGFAIQRDWSLPPFRPRAE
ncbi:trimeric intracellular cation channel family protein [Alsobacter sp. SYSU M60028]|uniref:Trimeric intracellular cation channel family protein n=1 Tax=Alsobacter ponti TaxID=2962936 RepID=A0ABT1LAQ0_9HYPH|nr:trimeric intracellular cation channel family protein [Alsobacter ponti]MCP8938061.1 trimeric intracellular cation channel family protein [Alsobacter ponti]